MVSAESEELGSVSGISWEEGRRGGGVAEEEEEVGKEREKEEKG